MLLRKTIEHATLTSADSVVRPLGTDHTLPTHAFNEIASVHEHFRSGSYAQAELRKGAAGLTCCSAEYQSTRRPWACMLITTLWQLTKCPEFPTRIPRIEHLIRCHNAVLTQQAVASFPFLSPPDPAQQPFNLCLVTWRIYMAGLRMAGGRLVALSLSSSTIDPCKKRDCVQAGQAKLSKH